jgi:uncharacterized membrane protein
MMANLHLLFWLSLVPFATGWMGENNFAPLPVALYGLVLLLAAIAYFILTRVLIAYHDANSVLAIALSRDFKSKISLGLYLMGVLLSSFNAGLACALYALVALFWLIPDRRIESVVKS